jgi:hypothetical protein
MRAFLLKRIPFQKRDREAYVNLIIKRIEGNG